MEATAPEGRSPTGEFMSESPAIEKCFDQAISDHLALIQSLPSLRPVLEQIASMMTSAIRSGNKIFWCGNGGSAADSQHMAAELVGRFRRERKAIPSIALNTNTSTLTAIGNDYGYHFIFQRQIEALCSTGDVVVGITTSGNSPNVCAALQSARDLGAVTVAFTGESGGKAAEISEIALRIPSQDTARIQEAHVLCGHMICDWIEQAVCTLSASDDRS